MGHGPPHVERPTHLRRQRHGAAGGQVIRRFVLVRIAKVPAERRVETMTTENRRADVDRGDQTTVVRQRERAAAETPVADSGLPVSRPPGLNVTVGVIRVVSESRSGSRSNRCHSRETTRLTEVNGVSCMPTLPSTAVLPLLRACARSSPRNSLPSSKVVVVRRTAPEIRVRDATCSTAPAV